MPLTLHVHHHILLQKDDPTVSLILARLANMANRQEVMMVDISKLTADVTALTAAITGVDNDLANLRTQIQTLSAQIAAGGNVTQAQIDALDSSVAAAVTNLNTQVSQDTPPATGSTAAQAAAPLTTDAPKA